ncbi:Planctomycete cytochrome C [Rubripirellula obstinata]|uniref:Planctomycete cytochrome C n=1 Tax=Rubripirellula obstinata TaxID=406547 RepID=A0A5B1CLZ8_9BACT|nr:c-type cytochrome domain-containing protein [Rubripirellula obstinata]KAA1260364.1 Planctomycete cytochrome C [Rubripirellula obstinata]
MKRVHENLVKKSPIALSLTWFGLILCSALLLGSTIASAEETEPEMPFALDDDGRLVRFDRDVAPILRTRCLECHNEEDARGDFRVDDRDTLLGYVEPDDAESSTLFADYLTIDDEDMLMPPRTHGGPLSASELSIIRVWINEGAGWPEDVQLVSAGAEDKLAVAVAPPTTLLGRVWAAQGFLHPATVHFPVALLLLGAAFVVLGWKWPAVGTQIPLACLLIGAVTAIASTAMGFSFAVERGYGSWDRFDAAIMEKEVFWHRWSGVVVSVLAAVFAIIALVSLRTKNARMTTVWKAGLLVCAAIVGLVGHQGGEMSYGEDFYPKMFRTLLGTPETNADAVTVSAASVVQKSERNLE